MTATATYNPAVAASPYNANRGMDSLTRLYRVAAAHNIPMPARPDLDCQTLLDAEPTAEQAAETAAQVAAHATDPTAWLAGAVDAIARAQAADLLREAMTTAANTHAATIAPAARQALTKGLGKVVAKLTGAIREALPHLDADDALNVDTAWANDASRQHKAATTAAASLLAMREAYTDRLHATTSPALSALLHLLDPAAVPIEQAGRFGGVKDDGHAPTRTAIRTAIKDAQSRGAAATLVRAIAGKYGDAVTVSIAADNADMQARAARFHTALSRVVGDTDGVGW